jgi:hypothetical protein
LQKTKTATNFYKVMDQNNKPPKIVFEGEEFQHSTRSFQSQTPKIVGWVIKYSGGYIKDERQANYVLIGFVVVAIILTFILLFSGSKNTLTTTQQIQLNKIEQLQNKQKDIKQ